MNIKQLFQDEDAVSPVIGVILMVAITVILAAVIGTFVLGLGDQVQSSAPNANFQFEYGTTEASSSSLTNDVNDVTIIHNGGQDVDPDSVEVLIAGEPAYGIDGSGDTEAAFAGASTISTGTSTTLVVRQTSGSTLGTGTGVATGSTNSYSTPGATALSGGDEILVVWTSPNGDSSNTIGSSTYPN